jgi:hypothetical protein
MKIWFEDMYGNKHNLRNPVAKDNSYTFGEEWYLVGRGSECHFKIEIPSKNTLAEIVAEELRKMGDKTVELNPDEQYKSIVQIYESISRRHILLECPKPNELPAQHTAIRKLKCVTDQYTKVGERELSKGEIVLITRGTPITLGGLSIVLCMEGAEHIPEGAHVIKLKKS